ncbi:MAG: hypothetical protein M1820_009506 [Bogoriella megaspora]|nr:MAG: hypothetical protein M1820_009506 [Bogoriella megaspora]
MAEVFATASAVVGVAAAAGQLIDGISKLRRFCSELREIPNDVQDALDDLYLLIDVLYFIRSETNQTSFVQGGNIEVSRKVWAALEQSQQHVEKILEEMQSKIRKRKVWGRVQAVEMKRKLDKASRSVENAQSLILMILATENRALVRQSLETQRQGIITISGLITTSSEKSCTLSRGDGNLRVVDLTEDDRKKPGGLRTKARKVRQTQPSNSWSWHVNLPWLVNQAWSINVHRASRGWDFKFRSFNIRPSNAAIFVAAQRADLQQVRRLLCNGKATLGDMDSEGRTLLHYAVRSSRNSENALSLVKFLTDEGADINATTTKNWTVYTECAFFEDDLRDSPNRRRFVDVFKQLTRDPNWHVPDLTIDMNQIHTSSDTFIIRPDTPLEVIRLVLSASWPPWNQRVLADRVDTFVSIADGVPLGTNTSALRLCLGFESFNRSWLLLDHKRKHILISCTSWALAYHCGRRQLDRAGEASAMLKQMLEVEPTSCFFNGLMLGYHSYPVCPIAMFGSIWAHGRGHYEAHANLARDSCNALRQCQKYNELMQEAARCFVSEMLRLGIDIDELVRLERSCRRKGWGSEMFFRRDMRRMAGEILRLRVIGFERGSKPEDWRLWLSNALDEWAGDFWDMIEHPERAMPGAWGKDEDDDEN